MSEESQDTESLKWLIETAAHKDDWDCVRSRCETHPEEMKIVDSKSGRSILHQLCSTAITPVDLIELVVSTYPEATKIQEKEYDATPLHVLCWGSQRSVRKVEIVLEHMDEESVLLRNKFGGTSLHSACGSHAWLPVIKRIVRKNPSILLQRTSQYNHTGLTALWHCHLQSIPGHLAIARILAGEEVNEEHFERFWEKVEFLACESFKLSPLCPKGEESAKIYLLHGLVHLRAPLNIMKVALKRDPTWAAHADTEDNFPLHHVVIRRPFRVKDIEIIKDLIEAYPQATKMRNSEGHAPIFIAIRDKMAYEEGLGEIVRADTDILASIDKDTGLYPFLLAASEGGRVAVNTTYQLLCAKPHLVKEAL
jgi:hypothetical protein